ncbi:hypothetical protein GALMADRAFT_208568 [Galerina marginata CBS 339.88]|uniref:Uncharacterized protein n=1 Tax=Galerina marginata (strain CBS 339.88) TaxID=685588 RepID=A0A067TJE0_GALM3|nr:hypothetical protein GALMADRAFT_208568 [Galerina marginata CBS 339.88]
MPPKRKAPDDFKKADKSSKNDRKDGSADDEREDFAPPSARAKVLKKRRGRPPGKRVAQESADDGERESSEDDEPPVKRPRGRPPKGLAAAPPSIPAPRVTRASARLMANPPPAAPLPVSVRPTPRRPSPGYTKMASEDEGYSHAVTKKWQRKYHAKKELQAREAFVKARRLAGALKRKKGRKTRRASNEDEDEDETETEDEEAADDGPAHGGRRDGGPDKDHEGGNRDTNDTNHDEPGANDSDGNSGGGRAGYPSSRQGALPPRAPSVDVFSAGPPGMPTKFVRGLFAPSPPLESDLSGSDFEETERAAKITRAFRNRRSISVDKDGDDDDDSTLQAEVVQSSAPLAGEDLDTEVVASSPAPPDDAAYVDRAARRQDPKGAPPPNLPDDEDRSAGDVASGKNGEARVGRISKLAEEECEDFGVRTEADAKGISLRHRLTVETVYTKAKLRRLFKRAPNSWNNHQAVEARASRVPGEGRDAFVIRARGLYAENIDPHKHTEEEIQAFKKELGDSIEELAGLPGVLKAPVSRMNDNVAEVKTTLSALGRFNPDIHHINFALYTGTDQAARQLSGIVTASDLVVEMIKEPENKVMVQDLVDMFVGMLSIIGKAKVAETINKGSCGKELAAAEPVLSKSAVDRKGKQRADRLDVEPKIVPIRKDGVDSAVAHDFRNVVTNRLLKMLNNIISSVSTAAIRTTMSWTKFGTLAVTYCLRIVSWPHGLLHIPGRYFDCAKLGLSDWKHLFELCSDGELKVVPWTPEQKGVIVGSVAFGEIPLVVSDQGITLLYARDVQEKKKKKVAQAAPKRPVIVRTPLLSPPPPSPPPPSSHRVPLPRVPAGHPVQGPDNFLGYEIVDQPSGDNELCRYEEPDIRVLQQQANAYEQEVETSRRGDMGRYAYCRLDGVDSAVAHDFRNVVTNRLLKMLNNIISSVSTAAIRTTMSWTKFGTLAVTYCLRIVSWPHGLLHIPGRYFDCAKLGLSDWKHLFELCSDGELKVVPWTPEQKGVIVGSVAFGEIPLVVSDQGITLLYARDVQEKKKKKVAQAAPKRPVIVRTPLLSPPPPSPPPPSSHRVPLPRVPAGHPVQGPDNFLGYEIVDQPSGDNELCRYEEPDIRVLQQQANAYEQEVETSRRGDMGRYAYRRLVVPVTNRPFLMAPGVPPPPTQLPSNDFYRQLLKPPSSRPLPPLHPANRVPTTATSLHRAPSMAQSRAETRSKPGPVSGPAPTQRFAEQSGGYAPHSRSVSGPARQPVAESSRMAQARATYYYDDYMDEEEAEELERYQLHSEV